MEFRWLLLVALAGCLEPNLTYCADGRACAADLVCDEIHHSCATPAQLTACSGAADGSACSAGDITGRCYDDVCIVPGCGNKIVEVDEQCDDGNQRSGDGCSADCRSTEICGNGAVDEALGEQCDDGNLASHDGCNSRCGNEAAVWTQHPVTVSNLTPRLMAFDPQRQRVVVLGPIVWEWDGAHWHTPLTTMPAMNWQAAVYDPTSKLLVAIGQPTSSSNALRVYTWDGTVFTELAISGTPPDYVSGLAPYDPAGKVMVFSDHGYYLDLVARSWSALPANMTGMGSPVLGYDPDLNLLALLDPSHPGVTYTWNGSAWAALATLPRASSNWSFVYDAANHHFLAVGGSSGDTDELLVGGWAGAGHIGRERLFTWFDAATGTVKAIGPDGDDSVITLTNLVMSAPFREPHPTTTTQTMAYDATRKQLEVFPDQAAQPAWRWDAENWSSLANTQTQVFWPTYDPVRGGVVAYSPSTPDNTLMFFTDAWTPLVTSQAQGVSGMSYDYAQRRLVMASGMTITTLSSTSLNFVRLLDPIWMGGSMVAYDFSTKLVSVETLGPDSSLYDLVGDQWIQSLSPGMGYRPFDAPHVGSLLLVPFQPSPFPRQLWERRNGVFHGVGILPMPANSMVRDVAELPGGRVMMLVQALSSIVMLERQLTSALPDETCVAGEDADGDGAAGCADPDCWWTCHPACPVATSCP